MMQELGSRLKAERKKAGLSQDAVGQALGLKQPWGHSYVGRLERGVAGDVGFGVVVQYLQACKTPVGRFMLELAQSGAFGEAEQGLTIALDSPSSSLKLKQDGQARAKLRRERRGEREAEDAAIIVKLWNEVQTAIYPLLPKDRPVFMAHYLEGVRAFYRAWKLATRGAVNKDPPLALPPSPHPRGFAPEDGKPGAIRASFSVAPLGVEQDVQMAFGRIEQAGVQRLVPAAVHKMREIVFERLTEMMPGATG